MNTFKRREVLRVICAKLQEPLGSGRGVLGSHAFHPVGEQQDESRLTDPLGLTRTDELVNDTLSRVAKVAELGFPHDQSVGVGHGVAQLKAHDAVLGQGGVTDGIGGLVGVQVGQGVVGGHVLGLVMEDVVAVREGASLHVLAGQADVNAFFHEGAHGHGLAQGPVHGTIVDHVGSAFQNPDLRKDRMKPYFLSSFFIKVVEKGKFSDLLAYSGKISIKLAKKAQIPRILINKLSLELNSTNIFKYLELKIVRQNSQIHPFLVLKNTK